MTRLSFRFRTAFSLILLLAAGGARADLTLVGDGVPACPVYAEPRQELAGRWLTNYLHRISGAAFPFIVTNEPPADGRAVWVGGFGRNPAADLPGDSFRIDVTAQRLQISGSTGPGVKFGVFGFLEEQLGCRWWAWNEEEVPARPVIRLPEGGTVRKAVFTQTILMNREAENPRNAFEFKCRVKNAEVWSGGHTLYPLLTPYAKDHPDIYPFSRKTGKREPNTIHFCYSAPGIAEALADALAEEVKKRNGDVRNVLYMAGMGDWYGGQCECERCEAVYKEEGWTDTNGVRRGIIGGTNLRMINKTAELLEARFPGVKVGTMAYMSMEAPPTLTPPRSNVYVRIPHLRHCIIHDLAECPKNKGCFANVKKWGELAPGRVHIWDYGVNFGDNFLYPFPVIGSIARNLRLYAGLGVAGLIIQGNYVSTGSDLVVLKNYVWRKLMADPGRDVNALIRECCDGYYGPAADPLFAYVTNLEASVALQAGTNAPHMDEFGERGDIRRLYLTPERTKQLRALMEEARARAAGVEPYARRVEEAAASLEAFAIWHPGPFAEESGKLVRADLNNAYTYDRAVMLCRNSRNASAREWGPYQNYHAALLAMQGGPLAVLSNGAVAVTLSPAVSMRIRQIRFRGKPLLAVPESPKEKGWPHLGGAAELAHPGWTTGVFTGVLDSTSAVMRAEAGSGGAKQVDVKRVAVDSNGVIRIEVEVERLSRAPDGESLRASVPTVYRAGRKPDGFRVEALNASNEWVGLAFALPPVTTNAPANAASKKAVPVDPEAAIPAGTTALRMTLSGSGCVVVDRYETGFIRGGKATFDARAGTLTVAPDIKPIILAQKEKRVWLRRTWTVSDLP